MKNKNDETISPPKNEPNNNLGRINREIKKGIFYIGIDREKKLNGFTPFMFREIAKAYTEFENNRDALCALVYSHSNNFCAGMDLSLATPYMKAGDYDFIHPEKLIDPLSLFNLERTKPVICAVRGITYTYGLELMLASDIAIAADNSRFAMLEVLRGVLMTGGATIRFIERAGWSNAMRYLLTGDEFDSKEAYRMNLIQEIVKPNEVFTKAKEIAIKITQAAPLAVKATLENSKLALVNYQKAISQLDALQTSLANSADAAEGLRAFNIKEKPNFSGK